MRRFKIGDRVVYQDTIGIVDSLSEIFNGDLSVGLIAEDDPEFTCTAKESECELYADQDISNGGLNEAKTFNLFINSMR